MSLLVLLLLQGMTGYPWIDAGMRQLVQEGWIHHTARHAQACFLTRGDLWINWEEGLKVSLTTNYSSHISAFHWVHVSIMLGNQA